MKTFKLSSIVSAAIALSMTLNQSAHAGGFLGDVGRAVGRAVGGSTGQAITNASNAGDEASRQAQRGNIGGAVQSSGQVIMGAGQISGGVIRDVAGATGNPGLRSIGGSIASTVTINSDVLGTATIVGGGLMQGQDIRQVYAAPLATAIYQARNAHIGRSRPIPYAIKDALRGSIPDFVLDNARYAVGDLEITVANVIGYANKTLGDGYAVTVNDVIVFAERPSDDPDDEDALHWWAHELAHVWQYRQWGVPGFALRYVNNYSAVEHGADQIADKAVAAYAD